MPRGRHGRRRHGGHRAHHRAHHHHHHGIGHHHHHGIGHHHGIHHHHHHHGFGRHHGVHPHHVHHVGWHFRPRRHRHAGGWPLRIVLFQKRRPTNVAPAITTVTTTTGETVNVAQPVTATVTQGPGMPTVEQPIVAPQQPGYFAQPPQATIGFEPAPNQPGYPPPAAYPYQPPQPDPYPPVEMKQTPAEVTGQPAAVQYDSSGQPIQANPNEEYDECACYCCCIL